MVSRKISLPKLVSEILDKLENAGFEAYVVGGCVRDSLLGNMPHDWDICTSAKPEEVKEVFKNFQIIETGIKHGTITVVIPDEQNKPNSFEITTYRIDGEYKDSRHPETVEYTNNLTLDLSRRDFTINAIAYNGREFIDPFNGVADIENGVLRCVGNPNERFQEDALRILRAIRFSLRFRFSIDNKTFKAMKSNLYRLRNISKERVCDELTKTLSEYRYMPLRANNIRKNNLQDVAKFLFTAINFLSCEKLKLSKKYKNVIISELTTIRFFDNYPKLVFLLSLIFKNTDVENVLRYFKFSNNVIKDVDATVRLGNRLKDNFPDRVINYADKEETKRFRYLCRKILHDANGNSNIQLIVSFAKIVNNKDINYNQLVYVYTCFMNAYLNRSSYDIYSLRQLDISGNDLIKLSYSGKEIGNILNNLLDAVIGENVVNKKEDLIKYIPNLT